MTHEQEILSLKAQISVLTRTIVRLENELALKGAILSITERSIEKEKNKKTELRTAIQNITQASLSKSEGETFNEWACRYVDAYLNTPQEGR